ncbi:hypothetical protein AVEN_178471-1 [Araneus ventricosus]|uniref:Uncharacterized protein n=1 Tax=Araneus ventricosus TaxID=182803 RepID=A0A4Y2CF14_ARAVE|nr:hypothetical protein AVEN_178471-1 [Araneus ventricosus]
MGHGSNIQRMERRRRLMPLEQRKRLDGHGTNEPKDERRPLRLMLLQQPNCVDDRDNMQKGQNAAAPSCLMPLYDRTVAMDMDKYK